MGSEAWELERRYSVPGALDTRGLEPAGAPASEDLHAWSIYRWVGHIGLTNVLYRKETRVMCVPQAGPLSVECDCTDGWMFRNMFMLEGIREALECERYRSR